jgi:hypothetical protein
MQGTTAGRIYPLITMGRRAHPRTLTGGERVRRETASAYLKAYRDPRVTPALADAITGREATP